MLRKKGYYKLGSLLLPIFHTGGDIGNVLTNGKNKTTRCNLSTVLNTPVNLDHQLCTLYLEQQTKLMLASQASGHSSSPKWSQLCFVYIGILDGTGVYSLELRKKQDSWEIRLSFQKDSTILACYSIPSSDSGG